MSHPSSIPTCVSHILNTSIIYNNIAKDDGKTSKALSTNLQSSSNGTGTSIKCTSACELS